MKTDDLIVDLARTVRPVRRLPHPWMRAALWAAATTIYLAGIVLWMAPRGRLDAASADVRLLFEQLAAGLVGLTAAAAAFATIVPGRRRGVFLVPIAAAGLFWIGVVAIGSVQDALRYGAAGIPLQTDWPCVGAMIVISALPAAALVHMLRRGAPLVPRVTLALAALSATALASASVCLVHPHDTSVTVLLWHGLSVSILTGLAWLFGAYVMKWPSRPV
jgi:hypothetical protein